MSFQEHQIDSEQSAEQYVNEEFIETNNETNLHLMIDELSKSEQNKTSISNKSLSLVLSLRIHDQSLSSDCSEPIKIPSFSLPSLTLSLVRKPYNILSQTPYSLLNDNHSITTLTYLDELQKEIDRDVSSILDMKDSIPLSAKQLETIERTKHRHKLQREIVIIAKKAIKPFYQKHSITKDAYKTIMKKVVTKATYSNRIDQKWIDKHINSYVKKYRTKQCK